MLLSIITAGRNDDYGGDFRGRTLKALDWNLAEARKARVKVEWLFVEWNPLSDKELLSKDLVEKGVRCYVVAPHLHDKMIRADVKKQMTFCQFLAINVGLRRATGHWLLCTHPDDLIGQDVWGRLAKMEELDPEVLYRARRFDLPAGHFATSWEDMKTYRGLDHGGGYTNAAGDFLLMSAYNRRGFDEASACFSDIHTDGRLVKSWMLERTGKLDWDRRYCQFLGTVYKHDHPMIYRRTAKNKRHHRGKPKWESTRKVGPGPGLYANSKKWGLSEHMAVCHEKVWYIGGK